MRATESTRQPHLRSHLPATAADIFRLETLLPEPASPAFATTFGEVGIRDFGTRRVSPQGPESAGPMQEAFRWQPRARCELLSSTRCIRANMELTLSQPEGLRGGAAALVPGLGAHRAAAPGAPACSSRRLSHLWQAFLSASGAMVDRVKVWMRLHPLHGTSCHRDFTRGKPAPKEEERKRGGEAEAGEGEPADPAEEPADPADASSRGPRMLLIATADGERSRYVLFYNKTTHELVKVLQSSVQGLYMDTIGAGVTRASPYCHMIPKLSEELFAVVGQTMSFNLDFPKWMSLEDIKAGITRACATATSLLAAQTVKGILPLDLARSGGMYAHRGSPHLLHSLTQTQVPTNAGGAAA